MNSFSLASIEHNETTQSLRGTFPVFVQFVVFKQIVQFVAFKQIAQMFVQLRIDGQLSHSLTPVIVIL